MLVRFLTPAALALCVAPVWAQEAAAPTTAPAIQAVKTFQIEAGRRIPLTLIKTISTRTGAPGDAVYMTTVFPVLAGNRIVIPVGSYVTGTLTDVKRAGKVKGRAELRMRVETLVLPNGVTHDFRGNLGGLDSSNGETMDRAEGTVKGKGGIGNDAKTVMTGAGAGGMAGAAAGGLATIGQNPSTSNNPNSAFNNIYRRPVIGGAIGIAAGAGAGLIATLLTRGPDAVLAKGTDLDMVLDRSVTFEEVDLAGLPAPPPGVAQSAAEPTLRQR